MRVFVAGASGVIGRELLPQLLAAGHEVTAMTRTPDKAARLRETGAQAVVCDAFDAGGLREAVVASAPEVVVHQLTALPADYDTRNFERFIAPTNRLRTEGTRNLVAAAQAAGARQIVAQSIAFMYAPQGDWVKDEDAPLGAAGGAAQSGVTAVAELERQTTEAEGIAGVALRYGQFYGRGTYYAPGGTIHELVRKRRFPIVGGGDGRFSFIHVRDAASATVAAIERQAAGVYNVVDDEPAAVHEWLPVYADAIGAKPPRKAPRWLARLVAGESAVSGSTELRGASNAKVVRELGWRPSLPSWREGFRGALDE